MLKPSSPRTEFNILKVAVLAAVVGILGGLAAELLERLIGFVINLSFYQRLETHVVPMGGHQLGPLVIFVPAIGGLEMLIAQGAKQFEIWTGEAAPIEAMADAVKRKLR